MSKQKQKMSGAVSRAYHLAVVERAEKRIAELERENERLKFHAEMIRIGAMLGEVGFTGKGGA